MKNKFVNWSPFKIKQPVKLFWKEIFDSILFNALAVLIGAGVTTLWYVFLKEII